MHDIKSFANLACITYHVVGAYRLHCKVSYTLWGEFFRRVRFTLVMPRRVVDLYYSWKGLSGSLRIIVVWKMIHHAPHLLPLEGKERKNCEDRETDICGAQNYFYQYSSVWTISIDLNGQNLHDFVLSIISNW